MADERKTDSATPVPEGAAPARAQQGDAARYLDLWERHLSLIATAGLKPPERPG